MASRTPRCPVSRVHPPSMEVLGDCLMKIHLRTGPRLLLSLLGLLWILPLCTDAAGAYPREYKKWRDIDPSFWRSDSYDSLGIHHAVILFDGVIIDESNRNSEFSIVYYYRRVRVLDDRGIEEFATVEIPFHREDKFEGLKARTLKPDGSEIKVEKDEVYDKTLVSFGKRGVRAKAFAFKGVEAGDILEYITKMRRKVISPPPVRLRHRYYTHETEVLWIFRRMPALSQRQAFIHRDDFFVPAYVAPNIRQFKHELRQLPDPEHVQAIYLRVRDLPPIPEEPFMPTEEEVVPLFIGHYQLPNLDEKEPYWSRAAKHMGEGTRDYLKKDSDLAPWMDRFPDERNLDADLRLCFEIIHENVKCDEFLPLDERSEEWPLRRNVNHLLEHGLGTSYDVSCLLVCMLQRLGYTSTVFWIRDRSEGFFLEDWQSARQFTMCGVVVESDDGLRWCFPAFPEATPDAMPWEAIGCTALLLDLAEDDDDRPFPHTEHIPMPGPDWNQVRLDMALSVDDDLMARGRLNATLRCRNELSFISELSTMEEDDALKTLRKRALPDVNATVHDAEFSLDDMEISYSCSLEVEGIVDQAASLLLVDWGALRLDHYELPKKYRELPIDLKYPCHYVSKVELTIPEGYAIEQAPPVAHLEGAFGEFRSETVFGTNSVKLYRDLVLKHSMFARDGAVALREFFDQVSAANADPAVLAKTDDGP